MQVKGHVAHWLAGLFVKIREPEAKGRDPEMARLIEFLPHGLGLHPRLRSSAGAGPASKQRHSRIDKA